MTIYNFFKYTPITAVLIVIIIAVFVIMIATGVNIDEPTMQDLIHFGANNLLFSLNQPYRLLTAGFVHIGIMHLLFNGFALYHFGQVCEKLLHKINYLAIFLLSIVGGNLMSLFWSLHTKTIIVSAGASGGIMGLMTTLIVISMSHHPYAKALNKQNLFMMMGINLLLGFTIPTIDNAGHIGGAITGGMMTLGFLSVFKLFLNKTNRQKYHNGIILLVIGLFVLIFFVLKQRLLALL